MTNCFDYLVCPVCQQPLTQINRSLKCPQNHAFDIAREGYVNLLLSRKKMSDSVGDSKEMLHARREFLSQGHYAPLSQAISKLIHPLLQGWNQDEPALIFDVGCGEGHYLNELHNALPHDNVCLMGMDVAKAAVSMAARLVKNGRFFVGNVNGRIPLPDKSVHIMLNIFSPRNANEFTRLIPPNGHLIIVIPQPNHLDSLREEFGLLNIEAEKREKITTQLALSFSLKTTIPIQFSLQIKRNDLENLLDMTPNARHHSKTAREKALAAAHTITTAAFELLHFTHHQGKRI